MKVTVCPTFGLVGENVKSTVRLVVEIVMVWVPVAVLPLPSLIVTVIVKVPWPL